MSAAKYGPDDTWPTHQKPFWNEALAEARQAGWTLTFVNAPHNFGVVSCPAGEHTFDVDKTARGGETKSKEAIKKIHWCGHGTVQSGSKVRARQEECLRLLGMADDLIVIAEEGLARAEAKSSADEDLDRLEIQLQTASSNVSRVEVEAAVEAALLAAIDVGNAPHPDALSTTLHNATETVDEGKSVAKALKPARPTLARSLLERANRAHGRIEELNVQLETLRKRIQGSSELDCWNLPTQPGMLGFVVMEGGCYDREDPLASTGNRSQGRRNLQPH